MSPRLGSDRIRDALGLGGAGEGRTYRSFAVDSREVEEGGLFFALPGARHHGFDFLEEAHGAGAIGAVVPDDRRPPDLPLEWFRVEDTASALTRLAAAVRSGTEARVVGITGSSGKTTVKEMLAAALAACLDVHRTAGNRNSQIGLPLSILEAPEGAEVWVLELGTSAPGEIAALTRVAAPDDALITTVGPAHLEELGSLEGVLDEKLDLLRGASPGGAAVVGEEPPALARGARAVRGDVLVAGLGAGADVRPDAWQVGARSVSFERRGTRFRVAAGGEHHLRDAVMAVALAEALGVGDEDAARGLSTYRPLGHRGAVQEIGDLTVLADCYNANPESFRAVVSWCVEGFPDRPRAAAVGSMLELGGSSERAHREIAELFLEAGFAPVVATGAFVPAFEAVAAGDQRVLRAGGPREAGERLADELSGDEVVVVKGSRGARMEGTLELLRDRFGDVAGSGRSEVAARCAAGGGEPR